MNTLKELIFFIKEEIGDGENNPIKPFKIIRRLMKKGEAHYLFWFRIAQYLHRKPKGILNYKKIAKSINRRLIREHNIDIGLSATIGPKIHFPHRVGIVITPKAIIGKNLIIRQNTTIGSKYMNPQENVFIGDNVNIGANVCIIGDRLHIGDNVTIGAMSFVNKDISDNTTFYTTHTPNFIEQRTNTQTNKETSD